MQIDPSRPLTHPGAEVPWCALFSDLRDRWLGVHTGRTSGALAYALSEHARALGAEGDVTPQRVSHWALGLEGRTPPTWAIMWLCDQLDLEVLLSPTGARLCNARAASGAA